MSIDFIYVLLLVMGWLTMLFYSWLRVAYPKPMITLEVGDQKFSTETINLSRLLAH